MRRKDPDKMIFAVRCLGCAAKWEASTPRRAEEFFKAEARRGTCGLCLGWGFQTVNGVRVPINDEEARAWIESGQKAQDIECERCGGKLL